MLQYASLTTQARGDAPVTAARPRRRDRARCGHAVADAGAPTPTAAPPRRRRPPQPRRASRR